jgi:hypothetical protein
MHRIHRFIAGALACLAVSGQAAPAPAQEPIAAPTYQRMRTGADDWQARGGAFGHGHGRGGWGWGGGFFQPYISPVIASSWYARPYPYHFDYFRGRRDGGQGPSPGEVPAPADCPCADVAP